MSQKKSPFFTQFMPAQEGFCFFTVAVHYGVIIEPVHYRCLNNRAVFVDLFPAQAVVNPLAVSFILYEARVFQDAQVRGDTELPDVQHRRQFAYTHALFLKHLQYANAVSVCCSFENNN